MPVSGFFAFYFAGFAAEKRPESSYNFLAHLPQKML